VVAVVVGVLSVVIGKHSSLWIPGADAWPIIAGLVVVSRPSPAVIGDLRAVRLAWSQTAV